MGSLLVAVSLLEGEKRTHSFGIQPKHHGSKGASNPASPIAMDEGTAKQDPEPAA